MKVIIKEKEIVEVIQQYIKDEHGVDVVDCKLVVKLNGTEVQFEGIAIG